MNFTKKRRKKIQKAKQDFMVKKAHRRTGLGLFTTKPIKKGDFVIEYVGPLISTEEADEMGGKYLFDIDKNWAINGSFRSNFARYINHSCGSNCIAEIDRTRVYIYAKRNIEEGEELTYHYGKEYFDEFIRPYGCKCRYCLKSKKK